MSDPSLTQAEERTVVDAEPEGIVADEPEAIAERAGVLGAQRLERSALDVFITALIGGVEVSLGCVSAMAVLGAAEQGWPQMGLYGGLALGGLVFPIGFLFVILGGSELFTENFLIPVVGAFERTRRWGNLARLWLTSWVGNLVGCAGIALLISVPDAIGPTIRHGYSAYAAYKLAMSAPAVFVSAILAGLTMTVLTWMLLALHGTLARIAAIFAAGYVLFATNLSHVVVGASLLFVGFAPAHRSLVDVIRWLLLATVGNAVGGIGFVTAFRVAQVKEKERTRTR